MSSFFTIPAAQKKRKRQDASSAPASKRRITTSKNIPRPKKAPLAKAKPKARVDESISGSDSGDDNGLGKASNNIEDGSDTDDANETAAEKRLKLAEQYLDDIRAEIGDGQDVGFDAEQIDRDLIAARLKEDVSEVKGRLYRHIAADLDLGKASHSLFRADTQATTGVAIRLPYVYTVSKDLALIRWELIPPPHVETQQSNRIIAKNLKPRQLRKQPKRLVYTRGNKNRSNDPKYQHHTAAILCVAASSDGKFVATGGADRRLIVWDAETLNALKVFTQHRDAVTGLAFRGKTNQLFSASKDRTIKIWSLDELAYIETLFGHQDEVVDISAVGGSQERCVSVGARDRTARLWKVVEESQLVFRGGGGGGGFSGSKAYASKDRDGKPAKHVNGGTTRNALASTDQPLRPALRFSEGSLDRVTQLDTQLFVTGSDSGALSLYALFKKKPLHIVPLAHGCDPPPAAEEASADMDASAAKVGQPTPRWITALACVPYSDLFLSGSWDGVVRVWRVSADQKRIESVGVLGETLGATVQHGGDALDQVADGAQEWGNASWGSRPGGLEGGCVRKIKGVINDLAVFERGDRGKDGVCVVAAVGTEARLGRWVKRKGKNGAVVFEVPRKRSLVDVGGKSVDGTVEEAASGVTERPMVNGGS